MIFQVRRTCADDWLPPTQILALLPALLLGYVVLMPVYGTSQGLDAKQFSGFARFTFNHMPPTKPSSLRFIAPLLVQYIVVNWMLFLIRAKTKEFIKMYQRFVACPAHAHLAQARTVLITGIPNDVLTEERLTQLYSLTGSVVKVWINHQMNKLPRLQEERLAVLNKVEGATATSIRMVLKKVKAGKKNRVELAGDTPLDVLDRYLEQKERPHHRLGMFGLYGDKVDSLSWGRQEIVRLNEEIREQTSAVNSDPKAFKPQNCAFILFRDQISARVAVALEAHHLPYRMTGRYTDIAPDNVLWSNLTMNPYERKLRTIILWAATIALCVFWTIPVGFVGIVSNVQGLADNVAWLHWLNDIKFVTGIIEGVVPTVLLAVLNMLLPVVLRVFAKQSGYPTQTGVELSMMNRFFLFQYLQNFILLTIVSGSASSIMNFASSIAHDPEHFPNIIAKSIPKASNFFLSFVALQGLSGFGGGMLQISTLVSYYAEKYLLASSPRKLWHVENSMSAPAFGTLFPSVSLVSIIGIGYCIISPIMAGFCFCAFILFWLLYRYNAIYVWDVKSSQDTCGLFFPKAINQLFAALYLEHILLAALFFLAQYNEPEPDGQFATHQAAIPEGAFTVALGAWVAFFHFIMLDSFKPLYSSLPLSLIKATRRTGSTGTHADDSSAALLSHARLPTGQTCASVPSNECGPDAVMQWPPGSENLVFDGESDDDLHAFDHPSMTQRQRPLWLPNDKFGIGSSEVALALRDHVEATNEHTYYTSKDRIAVSAEVPPGEPLEV